MKEVNIYTVDAFTNQMFKGNPAGVVMDADALTEKEMLNIAKEINLSETAFILNSKEGHFKIKYYTPMSEIDFCGHATVALSWILGTKYEYKDKVEQLTLETNIGMISIDWEIIDEKLESVIMTQVEPKVKTIDDINYIMSILGLKDDDIDSQYPIKCAYTGNWHLIIPVKTKEAIDQASPDYKELFNHNKKHKIATTHLFTFDTKTDDYLVYTRDFAPAAGVNEDPVTGSANGALAGYFALEQILDENSTYYIAQGNSFDRLGLLLIKTRKTNNRMQIQVGGKAVTVITGMMYI